MRELFECNKNATRINFLIFILFSNDKNYNSIANFIDICETYSQSVFVLMYKFNKIKYKFSIVLNLHANSRNTLNLRLS